MNLTQPVPKPPDKSRSQKQFVLDAFDRYERQLTAYALRLYGGRDGNLHAARDAVQFTFLKLCQQDAKQISTRLAPWLYTVCRNRIFDELKARKKRPQLSDDLKPQIDLSLPDPAKQLEVDDFLQRLPQLINALAANEKEVIELWSEGLKPTEIAEVLDKPAGTVRVTLHRGIKKLRQHPEVSHWLERATSHEETVTRSALNGSDFKTTTTTGEQK